MTLSRNIWSKIRGMCDQESIGAVWARGLNGTRVAAAAAVLGSVGMGTEAMAQCPPGTYPPLPVNCPVKSSVRVGVPGGRPDLKVAVRWGCMVDAPSCKTPGIVNESSFNFMLWRRHERASECIWIPACKVTMRSGTTAPRSSFVQLTDNAPTPGQPGDIVVSPNVTELLQLFSDLDEAWGDHTKGVLAISANRLINSAGVSVARGIAYRGVITMPYMAVADPANLCQGNERSLAHELGHVLSLRHTTGAGDLMRSGGGGFELTAAECDQARSYLRTNLAVLDPPLRIPAGFNDRAFDGLDADIPAETKYLDLVNAVVLDNNIIDEKVTFCAGNAGLIPEEGSKGQEGDVCVAFLLDCDNNVNTGGDASEVVPDVQFRGAEFVVMILVNRETKAVFPILKAASAVGFIDIEFEPGVFTAEHLVGDVLVCDPTPMYQGPASFPAVTEVIATLNSNVFLNALDEMGIARDEEGRTFPSGLRFQVVTAEAEGESPVDVGPSEADGGGIVMDFEQQVFPEVFVPGRVAPGSKLSMRITDMPAEAPLKVIIGAFEVDQPLITTDEQGAAEFEIDIPQDAPLGATLLTIGVDDINSTVTADGIISVVECPPDLDESGDLTIFDFLEFQNFWQAGQQPADYDGDGEITIFDFLAYQNDFEESCP